MNTTTAIQKAVYYLLQPLLLAVALWTACFYGATPLAAAVILVLTQLTLGVLEYKYPKRPDWRMPARDKMRDLGLFMLYSFSAVIVMQLYETLAAPALASVRTAIGLEIWPQHWPVAARILLALSLGELIWYSFHRLEHRFYFMWRLSGHGMHHSFKRLNAVNFNTNHPVEAFMISLPSLLVAFLLGAGSDAQAALLLVIVNTSCAHANVNMNSRIIGWFFSTNAYHFRHHSIVIDESNTNYGCAVIVWDRLFRTFAEGEPLEAGVGKQEPAFIEKMLMPFREPAGVDIAPAGHHS